MGWFVLISGVYMMFISLRINIKSYDTKNILLFKIIPIIMAIFLFLVGLNMQKVIQISL